MQTNPQVDALRFSKRWKYTQQSAKSMRKTLRTVRPGDASLGNRRRLAESLLVQTGNFNAQRCNTVCVGNLTSVCRVLRVNANQVFLGKRRASPQGRLRRTPHSSRKTATAQSNGIAAKAALLSCTPKDIQQDLALCFVDAKPLDSQIDTLCHSVSPPVDFIRRRAP